MPDPLARWWFIGSSGSGKTTYARTVAEAIGAPHFELDATFHQAGWTPLEESEFRSRVTGFVAQDRWTLDGNYRAVQAIVFARADVIVALQLPRAVVMRQVIARTLRRWYTREELWNGNREPLANFVRWDPEKSIIRWAWTRYERRARQMDWLARVAPAYGKTFVMVRSHAEAAERLAELTGAPASRFVG